MSRIAKKPIILPAGVTFQIAEGYYIVTGPKGEIKKLSLPKVEINQKENELTLTVPDFTKGENRAFLGTAARIIANMVQGVTEGFSKKLEINGVGFKAELKGKDLVLHVGYSHPVSIVSVPGVSLEVDKNIVTVTGIDKVLVGQVAANIRKVRKPEPYKGKGIKYDDEVIRRKEGKQVKSEA